MSQLPYHLLPCGNARGGDFEYGWPGVTSEVSEELEAAIEETITSMGRERYKTEADGNCMFEAIAMQVAGMDKSVLRAVSCAYAEQNKEVYEEFLLPEVRFNYRQMINQMKKIGVWNTDIGDLMPNIIASAIGKHVVVVSGMGSPSHYPTEQCISADSVVITKLGNHYEAALPQVCKNVPEVRRQSSADWEECTQNEMIEFFHKGEAAAEQLYRFGLQYYHIPTTPNSFFDSVEKSAEYLGITHHGLSLQSNYLRQLLKSSELRSGASYHCLSGYKSMMSEIDRRDMWKIEWESIILSVLYELDISVVVLHDYAPPSRADRGPYINIHRDILVVRRRNNVYAASQLCVYPGQSTVLSDDPNYIASLSPQSNMSPSGSKCEKTPNRCPTRSPPLPNKRMKPPSI